MINQTLPFDGCGNILRLIILMKQKKVSDIQTTNLILYICRATTLYIYIKYKVVARCFVIYCCDMFRPFVIGHLQGAQWFWTCAALASIYMYI